MKYDFSKKEIQELYRKEVKMRMEKYGMNQTQAEMLVAEIMMGENNLVQSPQA